MNTDERTAFADALSSEVLDWIYQRIIAAGDPHVVSTMMTVLQFTASKGIVAVISPENHHQAVALFVRQMGDAVPAFADRDLAERPSAGSA